MGEDQSTIPEQPPAAPVARLGDEATEMSFGSGASFALLQRAAYVMSQSTMVPQHFQKNIANCVIALNIAQRLRADPLMVMQNLYVVHGQPAWSAKFLIATINQSGEFSKLRYEWKGTQGQDDWGCRAWVVEKSTKERLNGAWITWKLANDEGWVNKNGSKWRTMPEQMFMYRAASFLVKTYAPEIAMGLPTREEMTDSYEMVQGPDGEYELKPTEWAEEQPASEPEPPKTNGKDRAEALADQIKSKRAAREAQQPPPEPEAPATSEATPEPEESPSSPRALLADAFVQCGEAHGMKKAKEVLEMNAGTVKLDKVKDEDVEKATAALAKAAREG
jgi:hypothetical protein